MYRVQVRQTDDPKPWYWRIVAKNGQVSLTSESYASKRNAVRAAEKFVTQQAVEPFVMDQE